jgi:hypothetical protein
MTPQQSPERPRRARRLRGVPPLLAVFVAALAAALALDRWRDAERRRELVAPPADPAMLPPPDLVNWRGAPLPPGSPAPGFTLTDVRTGERVSLDQFHGRPVVLLLSSYG